MGEVAEGDELCAVAEEGIFADVDPAVLGVETVGEDHLAQSDAAGEARVDDVVERAFGGGVNGRDADVNRVFAGRGALGESPRGCAVGGTGTRFNVAETSALRRARRGEGVTSRGRGEEVRAGIVHDDSGGGGGRVGQGRAGGEDDRAVIDQGRRLQPKRLRLVRAVRVGSGAGPAVGVYRDVGNVLGEEVQVRTGGVAGVAADADHLAMRNIDATGAGARLHSHRAHVSVGGVIAVGMMQFDVDAEVGFVILRVVPAGIDHLVGVRGGVDGTVTDAVVYAVVAVVGNPVAEAVTPVNSVARVAHAGLRGRRAGRRRVGTGLVGGVSVEGDDAPIGVGVVGGGVVEDGDLRGRARVRGIEKGRNGLRRTGRGLSRGARGQKSAEGESANEEGNEEEANLRAGHRLSSDEFIRLRAWLRIAGRT